MCGRYTLRTKLNLLLSQFAAELAEGIEERPRYNICPGEKEAQATIVRLMEGKRQLTRVHWPFVPSWETSTKLKYNTINAKAETVATSKAYRAAYRKRRCLVLADAYVEWKEVGTGKARERQPYLYEVDEGRPFAMAGLWDVWRGAPDAPPYESCTIVITQGNEATLPVHEKGMPVILHEEDYADWLAGEEIPLVSFPADRMRVRRTSTYI